MKHSALHFGVLASVLLSLSACGKSESPAYVHEALTGDRSSPWAGEFDLKTGEIEFRSRGDAAQELGITRYPEKSNARRGTTTCLIDVAPEPESAVRSEILATLNRNWRKVFEAKKEVLDFDLPSNREFRFDLTSQVAIVGPGSFFTKQESIQYKRLCLSRELIRPDAYNGMRVLELEAANNEGVAFFGFRFKKRNDDSSKPLLLMTHRKYDRYGQIARNLESVDSIFAPYADGQLGIPVGVYIEN